jgi:hypothetical protein
VKVAVFVFPGSVTLIEKVWLPSARVGKTAGAVIVNVSPVVAEKVGTNRYAEPALSFVTVAVKPAPEPLAVTVMISSAAAAICVVPFGAKVKARPGIVIDAVARLPTASRAFTVVVPCVVPAVNTPVLTTIVPIVVSALVHEIGGVPPNGVRVKTSPVDTIDVVGKILNIEVEGPNGVPSSSAPWQATKNPIDNRRKNIPFFPLFLYRFMNFSKE